MTKFDVLTVGNAIVDIIARCDDDFITDNGITEFYITGADAVACVKSTCYNMTKNGYVVHVFSDCITSYDKKKIDEMLQYYVSKGCSVEKLSDVL